MINIIKRNGNIESLNCKKIEKAVMRAAIDTGLSKNEGILIGQEVVEDIKAKLNDNITVEEIQDLVEESLMKIDRYRVAKAYILYRNKRTELRNKPWNMSELQKSILANKYLQPGETFDQWLERVSGGDKELEKLMRQKKFLFAGRILANRGLSAKGIKVTYSNCYVVTPPSDSIEGIYEAAYKLARTFSYGGC